MPPPPATARALRAAQPSLSRGLVGAWVRRDIEHNAAAKVQDHRQMQNFIDMDKAAANAADATGTAKTLRQLALDALAAGDPEAVKRALLSMGAELDKGAYNITDFRAKVATGMAIEGEDVRRNLSRTHEDSIKITQLRRRGQPDNWSPADPDGPGAA